MSVSKKWLGKRLMVAWIFFRSTVNPCKIWASIWPYAVRSGQNRYMKSNVQRKESATFFVVFRIIATSLLGVRMWVVVAREKICPYPIYHPFQVAVYMSMTCIPDILYNRTYLLYVVLICSWPEHAQHICHWTLITLINVFVIMSAQKYFLTLKYQLVHIWRIEYKDIITSLKKAWFCAIQKYYYKGPGCVHTCIPITFNIFVLFEPMLTTHDTFGNY